MFCDLVGSTGIAAQLDAEEWRDLVGAYLDAASAAVTEMGGHVAKKLGDGLMALFGYPVAQENDAERAVRAALAIQRALAELNRKNAGTGKPALTARIGLETGPVVVDAAGEIYGDVANIAARVQALAEPGAVLVTARVQRQVAGLFVAEERGTHTLKGVPEPTTLFRIVRASGGGRRSGQRHLTPLVGRDEEMAMLMRRWERARQGDGQLVHDRRRAGPRQIAPDRGISRPARARRRTPGSNGAARSFCRTRRCIRSPNGAACASAAPTCRRSSGSRNWKARWRRSSSTRRKTLRCSRRSSTSRCRTDRAPNLAPEELRRRQLAALTDWVMAGAQGAAGGAGVRGSALGRSDDARRAARHRRARRAGAAVHRGDDAARIPPALEHALASRHDLARAARSRARCATWWRSFRPATRCRRTWSRASPSAPAACRCSSRK